MESAPERSEPALQQLQSAFGMIPNLIGSMATSPVLINSLVGLSGMCIMAASRKRRSRPFCSLTR